MSFPLSPASTSTAPKAQQPAQWDRVVTQYLPGIILCAVVGVAAYGLQRLEVGLTGQAWIEALVLSILLGAAIRLVWTPSDQWMKGVQFSAKTLLEVAIALLGATVSGAAIMALGPQTILAIIGVVALAIPLSYGLGRAMGLPHAMALLVACGNAICGNSAIAAVAPVIRAEGKDVAAAIGFTAVLGIGVVLLVPVVGALMGYDATRLGVLAGLTVYAVPQVLAAAATGGLAAIQTGAVVKLVRVLMLGPVCLVLGLMHPRQNAPEAADQDTSRPKLGLMRLFPWFIMVFIALVGLRSAGLIPTSLATPLGHLSTLMTILAMAGLGLMVDPRSIMRAGPRVAMVAGLSALIIGLLALGTIVLILPN